jgi:hypothetical protein
MFARLQIDGPWHFAKFKNDLTDEDERDELEAAVTDALRPILEKCNNANISARLCELGQLVNELVPPELAPARPKIQREHERAPKRRSYVNGEVSPGKSKPQDGAPARTKRHPTSLLITFDGDAAKDGIGEFQSGRPHRVNLSKDDPEIALLIQHRDQKFGARYLYAIALCIFVNGWRVANEELPLPFGQAVSSLMRLQTDEAVSA